MKKVSINRRTVPIFKLTCVFLCGLFTVDVFWHFFSDGMRPGAGSQGDIAGILSPVFAVLTSSILALFMARDDKHKIRFHLFNLLFVLLTIIFWMVITYFFPFRYQSDVWLKKPYELIPLCFAYWLLFLVCYVLLCRLGKMSWVLGKRGNKVLLTADFFLLSFIPLFRLFMWVVWL